MCVYVSVVVGNCWHESSPGGHVTAGACAVTVHSRESVVVFTVVGVGDEYCLRAICQYCCGDSRRIVERCVESQAISIASSARIIRHGKDIDGGTIPSYTY